MDPVFPEGRQLPRRVPQPIIAQFFCSPLGSATADVKLNLCKCMLSLDENLEPGGYAIVHYKKKLSEILLANRLLFKSIHKSPKMCGTTKPIH